MQNKQITIRKVLRLSVGVQLMAFGTSLAQLTGLGIDPFNAFCTGVASLLNWPLGTFILLAQCSIALLVCYVHKAYLGIGSLIPMLCFGYLLQLCNQIMTGISIPAFPFVIHILLFLIAMIIIATGMFCYMGCQLGMVPYDALAFLLEKLIDKNAYTLRVILDVIVILFALLVHGPIQLGTLLLAFGIGPLLQILHQIKCMRSSY